MVSPNVLEFHAYALLHIRYIFSHNQQLYIQVASYTQEPICNSVQPVVYS